MLFYSLFLHRKRTSRFVVLIVMKAKSKKVKNTDILSAGSKIYAKKRKAKQETVEYVEFDPEKRQYDLAF